MYRALYKNNELLLVVLKTFRDCQGYQVIDGGF